MLIVSLNSIEKISQSGRCLYVLWHRIRKRFPAARAADCRYLWPKPCIPFGGISNEFGEAVQGGQIEPGRHDADAAYFKLPARWL
jgi:hypothetical protein